MPNGSEPFIWYGLLGAALFMLPFLYYVYRSERKLSDRQKQARLTRKR